MYICVYTMLAKLILVYCNWHDLGVCFSSVWWGPGPFRGTDSDGADKDVHTLPPPTPVGIIIQSLHTPVCVCMNCSRCGPSGAKHSIVRSTVP